MKKENLINLTKYVKDKERENLQSYKYIKSKFEPTL